jgi:hypothetical protein
MHELLLLGYLRLVFLVELLVGYELFFELRELVREKWFLLYGGFLVRIEFAGGDEIIKGNPRVCFNDLFGFGECILGCGENRFNESITGAGSRFSYLYCGFCYNLN